MNDKFRFETPDMIAENIEKIAAIVKAKRICLLLSYERLKMENPICP